MFIPIIIIGFAFVLVGLVALVARRWTKCAPNEVLVVYGRKRSVETIGPDGRKGSKEQGYRLIRGGATFVMPVLEAVERVSLNSFPVPFSVEDTPNVDGVLVNVDALANMKVASDPALLSNAVECLLETSQAEVQQTATDTLSGLLRQIVGTLTVEEIIKDREKIAQQVLEAAVTELGKLGFELKNFVIQKITDREGYIEALGKKRTAEVKSEATIAEAEARRDADVRSAAARQEGEIAQARADEEISNANRQRDEVKAKNDAAVQSEQARIEVRAATAKAEEDKSLRVAEVAAEEAEVQARTRLQEEERKRRDAELRATVIVQAEREKEATVIAAQAEQEAAVKLGEASRIRRAKEGEGEREYLTAAAEGRKRSAEATQAEKEAEAAGQKALLLAEAEGLEAKGKAEGTAKEAVLIAEARGLDEKNKALAQLSEGARLIMVLEQLPTIVEQFGDAGEKIAAAVFESIGTGLSQIDEVRIVDLGGGNGHRNGESSVAGFANAIPEVAFGVIQRLQSLGVDVDAMLSKAGVDMSNLIGGARAATPAEDGRSAL
jgi:flotillin